MKFIITIFLIIIYTSITGQKKTVICGRIKSSEKFILHIYEPLNGYYNSAFLDTSKINSSLVCGIDSFFKVININVPSFIKIYFTREDNMFITLSDVLLFPGDSVHLVFDLANDSPNSVIYSGSNASGQKLFNEINFDPYKKFIPVYDLLDSLSTKKNTFVRDVDNIISSSISKFDSLQKKSLCSKIFVEYMNMTFKAIIYNEVIKKFLGAFKQKEVLSQQTRDSIISVLFHQHNPTDIRLRGLYLSTFYLDTYINYLTYKKYKLNSIDPIRKSDKYYTAYKKRYLIKTDFVPFLYITDEDEKQNLWALEILLFFHYLPGKYDKSVITQFNSIFPKNQWKFLLEKQFVNNKVVKKIEYKLLSPIQIVDSSNNINSLSELIYKLPPGKPIFVDIWATWCAPCIATFAYNKQLDSFLLINKITRLYISLDNFQDNMKWEKALQKYSLGGYHILARDNLKSDIKTHIYSAKGNEGMPIPRYILIDKDGKIVIDDAYSPIDIHLLKEQIIKNILLTN